MIEQIKHYTRSNILPAIFLLSAFIIAGCGATSTGSRYEEKESKKEEPKKEKEIKESFDMAPYKTKLETEKVTLEMPAAENIEVWYGYEKDTTSKAEESESVSGFRVQVISTDNLEEAEAVRSEVIFKTGRKNVYITFDPPFYKVKAGDFTNRQEASNLSFQLTQMGYSESRIVNDSVNVQIK